MSRNVTLIFHPCIYMDVEVDDDFDVDEANNLTNDELRRMFMAEMQDMCEWEVTDYDCIEVEE